MISFVLSDMRRLWAGSLAIILLVALSCALGVAVTLQERALRLGSARAADKFDLIVGASGSETQLVLSSVFLQTSPLPLMSGEVLVKLAADPRVSWAAPVGFGDSFAGYPIVGTTTTLIENTAPGFVEGGLFSTLGQAVVGSAVTLPIGAEIKPLHGLAGQGGHTHGELAYHVTGRLKPTGTAWDRAILVPIQAVWRIHGMEEAHHDDADGAVDEQHHDEHDAHTDPAAPIDERWSEHTPGLPAILVKPKSIADAYRLRQDYRAGDTVAVFPAEVLTGLYATLGDAKLVLVVVSFATQILVAAALLLVTVIHIGQRSRQIGALRAFGAPRSSIFAVVWLEFFSLVAIGIGLGFGLGYMAAHILSGVVTAQSGVAMPVGFTSQDGRTALILLAVAAVLASLPALLAYRQSPAAALRS